MGHKNKMFKPPKPTVRYRAPVMGKLKGKDVVMCPFCDPPHALSSTEPSPCGTILQIQAVQAVFHNQKCALCGKVEGETIMAGDKYVHTYECTHGKLMFAVPPKKSVTARIFWRFPDAAQLWVARKFGTVVMELKNGSEQIVGYTWKKVQIDAQTKISVSGGGYPGLDSAVSTGKRTSV